MKKEINLPWFKLDAIRFLHSNTVLRMSMEEIGTFVLLLMHSWAQAKDCLLPEPADELCSLIRAQKITPRVLEEFPIVQTKNGPMRRNEVLYEKWKDAKKLSKKRRDAAVASHNSHK